MGTEFRIVLHAATDTEAKKAAEAAFDRVAALDRILSDYKDDSELMRLCKQAGGSPVNVSEDLFTVLEASQELARKTDGAFDVTAAPVIRLWRRARRQHELPDEKRLAAARATVGFEKLKLEPKGRTAQLAKPGMLLDLGGIAKGYAADEAMKVLKQHGIASALVAAGGDIVVSAPPPGAKGWTIGILPLSTAPADNSTKLLLRDAAASTSGDREQFVEIGGKRYSHIIDPRTGMALTGHASVTVVAQRGIDSDSLATAVSVLGPERGLALIDGIEGAASLIVRSHGDKTEQIESKRWKDVRKAP
jgi:thiamine biosynthesis lipoprotein